MINDRTTVASCCTFRRKDLGRRVRHSIVSSGDERQECDYCGGAFRSASGRSAEERAHYWEGRGLDVVATDQRLLLLNRRAPPARPQNLRIE